MELTKVERLILHNQYEIMKLLDKSAGNKEFCENAQTILEYGYSRNYDEFSEFFADEELSQEKMDLVFDALDLYRCLRNSYEKLSPADKVQLDSKKLEFRGFDGNYESEYLCYANFVINDLGRYAESKREDYNTHAPMVPRYVEMLARWIRITEGGNKFRELDLNEIKSIIA
ncbi:MAG TPA: YfbU family protein [Clostridia bacterium]|nr:YfbU family protein [Clostridia bacterium]